MTGSRIAVRNDRWGNGREDVLATMLVGTTSEQVRYSGAITSFSHAVPPEPELPPRVRGYLDAIAGSCAGAGRELASILVFGSAAKGGFARQVSDVDLIVVLPDGASREERMRVRDQVSRLEIEHGFKQRAKPHNLLQAFAEHAGGEDHSCFVCTQSDLLSGDVARVFDLKPAEALFVDRIVFANVIASSATVWAIICCHSYSRRPCAGRMSSKRGLPLPAACS